LWLSGCSHSTIKNMTKYSQPTISKYLTIFREAVTIQINDTHNLIGGRGITVEIDESKFGKRKYHKGKKVEGVWIVGGVERTTERKLFAETVLKRDEATLIDVIKRNVHPESIIHTDLWRSYNSISTTLGITHKTVNHSKNFVDPVSGVHTNTIEGTWHGIKIHVPERARHKEKVENHLSEFIWRRQNKDKLWDSFIICLGNTKLE
jgi:transposase-like protein